MCAHLFTWLHGLARRTFDKQPFQTSCTNNCGCNNHCHDAQHSQRSPPWKSAAQSVGLVWRQTTNNNDGLLSVRLRGGGSDAGNLLQHQAGRPSLAAQENQPFCSKDSGRQIGHKPQLRMMLLQRNVGWQMLAAAWPGMHRPGKGAACIALAQCETMKPGNDNCKPKLQPCSAGCFH